MLYSTKCSPFLNRTYTKAHELLLKPPALLVFIFKLFISPYFMHFPRPSPFVQSPSTASGDFTRSSWSADHVTPSCRRPPLLPTDAVCHAWLRQTLGDVTCKTRASCALRWCLGQVSECRPHTALQAWRQQERSAFL